MKKVLFPSLIAFLWLVTIINTNVIVDYAVYALLLICIALACAKILDRLIGYVRFFIVDSFFSSIIINATIYTKWGMLKHYNLGDDLNYYLVRNIQKKKVSIFRQSILAHIKRKKENFIVIGSTLTFLTNKNSIVWGAGAIFDKVDLPQKPRKICAVRGPLTRKYLLSKGVSCPEVYGDPALLMKYVYQSKVSKKYILGVIPHYKDFDAPVFDMLKKNPNILFIKMKDYKSVENVIDQIVSCEKILSTSLHGLILSECYHVPNIWIKVSDNIFGGTFKYLDYYESIGIKGMSPYLLNGDESEECILNLFDGYKKGRMNLKPLIEAAPFELSIKDLKNEDLYL